MPALASKANGPFAIGFYRKHARDKISLFLERLRNLKSFGEEMAELEQIPITLNQILPR
jgi:hypothetical protein